MRLGGIVRLGEKVVADSHGLLHHLENLRLFRRLKTNCHIAVENHLFQTIVDLLFRYLKLPYYRVFKNFLDKGTKKLWITKGLSGGDDY